ncbi:thiamine kinase [Phytobacter palmae]|nr:thiamine kinase [Phytobacter palmae]
MRFSNNNLTRDALLSRYFPHYAPVDGQVTGLSGGSCLISNGHHCLILRQQHQAASSPFLRQYRALKRLPRRIAPQPRFFGKGWMVIDYIPGVLQSSLPASHNLAVLLYDLHRCAPFGWRLNLLPLLEAYWQQCLPSRRTLFWLQQLKLRRKEGEPVPLRLAPLHMDVHAGNLVHSHDGLRLIDWEYAGDGDIAMELAGVWTGSEHQRRELVAEYAHCAMLDETRLWRQVLRWRPWIAMLMAGWFECRWQQTGDRQFITLADAAWRQLKTKGKER